MNDTCAKILDLAYFHFRATRLDLSRRLCEEVLADNPENLEALYLLARVASADYDHSEALRCLTRVLSKTNDPRWYDDYYQVAYAAEAFDEAISFLQERVAIDPDDHLAHCYLGHLYLATDDTQRATDSFKSCLALSPELARGYAGLAETLERAGDVFEALEIWRTAIDLEPTSFLYLSKFAHLLRNMGAAHEAVDYYSRARGFAPENASLGSMCFINLLCTDRLSPEEVFAEHLRWVEQCVTPLELEQLPNSSDSNSDRLLTIGYVSGDFRSHPVAFFIEPVLAGHNRDSFRIILYSVAKKSDYITEQFQKMEVEWRDISRMGDAQAADLIRKDGVDILVDLNGHTNANRLLLFARKPAPVQVTWLGYANTTGLDTIDYRISDSIADPPGMTEHIHSETLWRLPGSFICYRSPQNPPPVGPSPFREKGYVTFAVFNNFAKVTSAMMDVWIQILQEVPESRLVIKSPATKHLPMREHIIKTFRQAGIAEERIEPTAPLPSVLEHLAFITQVDIALDTYPYNGTTTTCEALWMGVPVVTLAGRAHVSRVGASLLTSVGLPELIADSPSDYVSIAKNLARDHARLDGYRTALRDLMQASPLTDVSGFTRNLEDAYRRMWRKWCESSRPHTAGNSSA